MDVRTAKREAKFRAGLILESVIQAGWAAEPSVIEKYGQEAADRIGEEILTIANRLIETSGPGA